ncbi:hypothetical protein Tco_1503155 [Tanacetum coccineum]
MPLRIPTYMLGTAEGSAEARCSSSSSSSSSFSTSSLRCHHQMTSLIIMSHPSEGWSEGSLREGPPYPTFRSSSSSLEASMESHGLGINIKRVAR